VSELTSPVMPAAAEGPGTGLGLTDSIYNRLLKERIIWLGSEVRDDNANAICAQMLLLAAEDPDRLMHQPAGGAGGSATDIRINADLIIKMKQQLAEITAANTGHTVEEIIADSDRDHWFSASEALDYGFIDHIVTSSREIGAQNGEN